MNYADIAIIVVLVLSVIFGLVKGFWRSFSKIITLTIAIALGFVFAAKLAPIIFKGDALQAVNGVVGNLIVKSEVADGTIIKIGNEFHVAVANGDKIMLENALKSMLIPSFLQAPIIASAAGLSTEALISGVTVGQLVSSAYTHLATLVISGGIIFLVSLIILRVIANLIYNAINNKQFHRALDRILGGVFHIVTGCLFIIIVFHVFSMISGMEFMTGVIEHIEAGKISGPLFDANLLNKIFYGDGMTKLIDTLKNVILTATSDPAEGGAAAMLLIGNIL